MRQIRALHQRFWVIALVAVLSLLLSPAAFAATTTVNNETELRNAVGQGSSAGDIKLGQNITLTQTLDLGACTTGSSDHVVTIDLAGHELRYPKDYKGSAINVPLDYTLTLRDTSGRNAGSVTGAYRAIENHGTFKLVSGRLANNSGPCDGNGLFNAQGATATISGGIIEMNASEEGHCGGGIYNRGTLTLTSGTIQNNLTDARVEYEGGGGGIYNGDGGNLTVSGGVIQNNQSDYGGGIYNDPACEVMVLMGRARIQGNTAVRQGGGIYNGRAEDGTKLALLGGIISENTANLEGGGIMNAGMMAASLVNISKNKAGTEGGGIFNEGSLALSESPVVQGNKNGIGNDNDVYMKRDKTITIEGALNNNAKIGIMCEDPHQIFTNGYGTFNSEEDPSKYFFGNPNDNQKDILIRTQSTETGTEAQCVVVIHYLDENGAEQKCVEYADVASDSWGEWGTTSWYAVRRDTTIDENIGVRGDVHLILVSGKTLRTDEINVRRNDDDAETRAVFNVYNSVGENGYLIADGTDSSSAGIGYKADSGGVGTIIINGGDIKAYGGGDAAGIGGVENRGNGPITINGGKVYAEGGKHGAGIGGGQAGDQDNPININGGVVEAHGGEYSAGIGGGDSDHGGADGGETVIRNATVYAYGGSRGAGIGGGEDGHGSDVTIENSTVYAYGGGKGPGIGGGQDSNWGGTCTVYSGYVEAYGGFQAAGIGGGEDSCGGNFTAMGGTIIAAAGDECATAIGAGHGDYHENGKWVYERAMVHAGDGPNASNYRIMNADERVAACGWHYVRIEPCTHEGSTGYTDKDASVHEMSQACAYCGLAEGAHDEPHAFSPENHTCVCGHREIPIELKRNAGATIETTYVSEGASYVFRTVKSTVENQYFSHWLVSGLEGKDDNTKVYPGEIVTAKLKSGASQITAVAQWAEKPHKHGFSANSHKRAVNATCTTEGNVEYWVCDQAMEGGQPCRSYFVRAKEGQAEDATVTEGDKEVRLVEVEQADTVISALGHDWGEATYTWSQNDTACTASHACKRDASHTATEKATEVNGQLFIWSHEASCTKPKSAFVRAIFKSDGFVSQQKTTEEGDALGHTWGAPSYTWSDDNRTCTATRTCGRNTAHAESETVETSSTATEPTCIRPGTVTYMATFENEAFEVQTKKVQEANPLGHNWGEPTYVWSEDLKTCTATRVCANNTSHVESETATVQQKVVVAATCTQGGEIAHMASFRNKAFFTQTKATATNALGHVWGDWVTKVGPSELKPGWEMRVCRRNQLHIEVQTIPIANHDHQLTHVEAKSPTCTEAGNKEYWVCNVGENPCGGYFVRAGEDETPGQHATLGEEQIGVKKAAWSDIYLPALGHSYGDAWYRWNADGTEAVAVRVCQSNPVHLQIGVATVEVEVVKSPTCTEMGEKRHTATFENPVFATQVMTSRIQPLGHAWGGWSRKKEPTCTDPGIETRTCVRDSSHTQTREVAANGHDWGVWSVTTPATETNEGVETRTCISCRKTETRAIPRTSHIHVLTRVAAVAATCTTEGNSEYWVCDGGDHPCNACFVRAGAGETAQTSVQQGGLTIPLRQVDQEDVVEPALGHDWLTPTYAWSDDHTSCVATRTCKRDESHVESEAAASIRSFRLTSPTCTEPGETRYIASFADKDFGARTTTVATPATGHAWGSWNVVTPATATESGQEKRICKNDPSHEETRVIPVAGHEHGLSHVAAKDATCTEEGNNEYWVCDKGDKPCGRYFLQNDPSKEVEWDEIVIPAEGHTWGEPFYKWSGDGTACVAARSCTKNPAHFQVESTQVETTVVREPTCAEPGQKRLVAMFRNPAFQMQVKVATVESLGHEWGEWEVTTAPTCTEAGVETRVCTRDDEHVETRNVLPLGHDWGPWTLTVPATQTSDGVETRVCARCGGEETRVVPAGTHVHQMSFVEAVDATCTEAGSIAHWTCQGGIDPCGRLFADPLGKTELTEQAIVIPALDHDWGKPTYEWSDDSTTCTATRVCKRDATHVEIEVANVEAKVERAATCTESGRTRYAASFTNAAFSSQTKTAVTSALGHTPAPTPRRENVVNRTCEEPGSYEAVTYCSVCKKQIGDPMTVTVPPAGHDWGEWSVVTPATCEGAGKEQRICSRDEAHIQERDVEPLGHEWGAWVVTKVPTTSEKGEETRTCVSCNKTETREIDPQSVDPQPTDPQPMPITFTVHVSAVAPTCDKSGNVEYWVKVTLVEGVIQNTYYSDSEKQKVIDDARDTVLPALGHDWDEGSYAAETDKPTCTLGGRLMHQCQRTGCDATTTEIVDPLGHVPTKLTEIVLQEPSCEIAGFAWRIRSCERCGREISRDLIRTDPLGHKWHEWGVTEEPTEAKPGEMERVCERDKEHQEVIVVPPLDHDWGEPTYTWSDDYSTCTVTRICLHNHTHTQTEVAHKDATPSAVSKIVDVVVSFPTCEEPGEIIHTVWFTNSAFLPQTVREQVPALGHDWGEWGVTTPATCTEAGVETRTCRHDSSHVETRELPALGHDWGEWVVTKEATETEEGVETRTCARCGKTEVRAIPKPTPEEVGYRCVTDDVVWVQGSSEPAVFTFKRNTHDELTFEHFMGVVVDGAMLEGSSFDAVSGSVVVSLKPEYLETLAVGNHSVQALFDDGDPAEGTLIVQAAPEPEPGPEPEPAPEPAPTSPATPATGDSSVPAWLVLLLAGAGTALCVRGLRQRRRS